MVNSPSQKWEDGKLVERAQDARGATEENTAQAVTGRTNDTPVRSPEEAPLGGNSTFGSRGKAGAKGAKAVDSGDAEDKSVGRSERKSTRGRR